MIELLKNKELKGRKQDFFRGGLFTATTYRGFKSKRERKKIENAEK
jgi:hypothetical protein